MIALIHRLESTDNFGLVTFDDQAQVVVPSGPLTDKPRAIVAISAIGSGGSTDLGAGYLRGLREARRVSTAGSGATVLVVSDGHVNQGLRDLDEFASLGAKAYEDRIVTSTLGYGQGYDESLLVALARAGAGNHVFADNPDEAGAKIAAEVDGLIDKVVQAATVTVQFQPTVEMLRLYNDVPAIQIADGEVMIEVGDLYADESRKLLMRLRVPAMAALGAAQVANLRLQYVELPRLVEHTIDLPISVNVVPGDEAAGRIPDPIVHSEVLFQEAQDAKRKASEAFERGDVDGGREMLAQTRTMLGEAGLIAPSSAAESIQSELGEVELMQTMSLDAGGSYMSKRTRENYHRQNRKRGRD